MFYCFIPRNIPKHQCFKTTQMHLKHLIKKFCRSLAKLNMLRNPAGERNKQPILETIQQYIKSDAEGNFLEISSGKVSFIILMIKIIISKR